MKKLSIFLTLLVLSGCVAVELTEAELAAKEKYQKDEYKNLEELKIAYDSKSYKSNIDFIKQEKIILDAFIAECSDSEELIQARKNINIEKKQDEKMWSQKLWAEFITSQFSSNTFELNRKVNSNEAYIFLEDKYLYEHIDYKIKGSTLTLKKTPPPNKKIRIYLVSNKNEESYEEKNISEVNDVLINSIFECIRQRIYSDLISEYPRWRTYSSYKYWPSHVNVLQILDWEWNEKNATSEEKKIKLKEEIKNLPHQDWYSYISKKNQEIIDLYTNEKSIQFID